VIGNYSLCNLPVWCSCRICISYSIRQRCPTCLQPAGQTQYNKLDFYAGHEYKTACVKRTCDPRSNLFHLVWPFSNKGCTPLVYDLMWNRQSH